MKSQMKNSKQNMCCLFFNGDDGHNYEYNNDNNILMNTNTLAHSHLGTHSMHAKFVPDF